MCGLTGWLDWTLDLRLHRATVEAMTRTLALRGPDGTGVWASRHVALGHTRLSVIDLAGGAQPMAIGDQVLVFTGEIYNFRELRAELGGLGHRFTTASDTEVLLRSYQQWGPSCAERLTGMFAFAVWDERTQELFLCRDRLGVKPLYFHRYPGGLLFGSEPKALLAGPHLAAELSADGVGELFAVPGARTPGHGVFRGLEELRPGHTLTFGRSGPRVRRYWQLDSREHPDDVPATVATVRELLSEIVEQQLVSDVPVAALLSGGVDSGTITALAAQARLREGLPQVPAFSMDYGPGGEFVPDAWRPTRDGPFAELAAAKLGIPHTGLVLSSETILAAGEYSLSSRDLPGWGDLDASLGLLFAAVREGSTVALSGESADEMFGGYPWYARAAAHDGGFFPWLDASALPALLLRDDVRDWVRPEEYARDRYAEAVAEVPGLAGESAADRRIRRAFYLGLTRWLPLLLDRKDRLSMRTGLEVRVPYCDHRLVEYTWNVPWEVKSLGGVEKGLLREAAAGLLPDEILNRRKCAPPACRDGAYTLVLERRLAGLLAEPDAPLFQLVDRDRLAGIVRDGGRLPGPTPGPNTHFGMGYLLDVDQWMRRYAVTLV
ncbi:asparagine synthase (glutamine-hydrolyzing) [Actinomadura terrae]|uniref:asparagine synthase (glutamine-hydrolyzing) n=1 Tax=Actinomadura terrae TaxID=604353 RepID=UPI001FA7AF84|nr:asparagine synthase (glutamine-hydrolyzing) [Actinomadura terrae]